MSDSDIVFLEIIHFNNTDTLFSLFRSVLMTFIYFEGAL